MPANIVRRDDYKPAPVSRSARRELERIEAQQQAELVQVAGSERAALLQSRMRTRGSELLRGDAIDGIGRLISDARAKSRGDALTERLMVDEVIGYKADADLHAISYAGRRLS